MRRALIAVALIGLAGCGSGSKAADTRPDASTLAATTPPSSTTTAPTAAAAPTTTGPCTDGEAYTQSGTRYECVGGAFVAQEKTTTTIATLSRDAAVAAQRCIDAASAFALGTNAVIFTDATGLQAAEDLCDEATLQLDVDDATLGATPINQLSASIAGQNVAMSFLALKVLGGSAAPTDGTDYDTQAMKWGVDAQALLAAARG